MKFFSHRLKKKNRRYWYIWDMHSAQCCDLKIWKTFQVGFSVLPSPSIPSRPVGPPRRHLCCRLGRALRLHGETAVPDGLLAPRSAVQRFSPEGRQKRPQNRPRFLYGRFLPKGRPGEFAALQQRHQVWRWRFLQIEWFRDGYFSPMLLQHQFCDNSADGIRWFFRLNPFRWSKNPEKIPSLPVICLHPAVFPGRASNGHRNWHPNSNQGIQGGSWDRHFGGVQNAFEKNWWVT